jgi:hypothetical protein
MDLARRTNIEGKERKGSAATRLWRNNDTRLFIDRLSISIPGSYAVFIFDPTIVYPSFEGCHPGLPKEGVLIIVSSIAVWHAGLAFDWRPCLFDEMEDVCI